ncbi:MAG: hypothetical protein HN368_05580 [Spirochaetales bacterium]|nr:hypothetical protein [Spirochaetales bacterium]
MTLSASATLSPTLPVFFDIDVSFRTYIAERLDAGLQFTGPYYSATADVKYQILTEPFYLAASVGAGVIVSGYIAQALLIGGTETFYIGIKPLSAFTKSSPIGGMILAGTTLGENRNFIIEANAGYLPGYDYGYLFGYEDKYGGLFAAIGAGLRFKF